MRKMPPLMTAMVTPFDGALEVDVGAARELAQRLVEEGSVGLVVCGTTGEAPTLSTSEKALMFRTVAEVVGSKAYVVAGTGTNNTAESLELTRLAEDAGAHAVMLTTPPYNKPPQDCLVRHFTTLAEATPLPVVLYQVPSRTATRLEPATTVKLAHEVDNIVALKDAGSNIGETSAVRRGAPESFLVYSGNDGETLPILAVGGCGVVSVASHVAAGRILGMIEAYGAGDVAGALRAHLDLMPIFDILFVTTSPIPVKAACELRGIKVGGLRAPLYEASDGLKERIAGVLRECGVI